MTNSKKLLFFTAVAALTLVVYWPGLSGDFLLDDTVNLAPVWLWLEGQLSWLQVVTDNRSGPLGRPISLLSFVSTAAVFGQSAMAFKAVNLGLHIATGGLIFLILQTIFKRDRTFRSYAAWWALAITAIWLLHPLLTSTVLYVVQRMTILSALFVALGLWSYLQGRNRIESGESRSGIAWLFLGVPACTALAALSKETGLLLPLMCAVIEWTHFRPSEQRKRSPAVVWFLALIVGAPVFLGALYLFTHQQQFLGGYENRPFSLVERLLTESRVVFDYVGSLLIPSGQDFSLYRDDYPVSTGLLSPFTTIMAIGGWVGLITAAFLLRRRIPGFTLGVGFFLVGHSMESTIFPLLIYFEHRNYLPGLGILVATASLLAYAGQALAARMDRPGLVFGSAGIGLLLALSFATYARALAWQSPIYLLQESVAQYPDSRLARMELASYIMNSGPFANVDLAREQYRHLQEMDAPSTRALGYIGETAVSCYALGSAKPELLENAFEEPIRTIQADHLKALEDLGQLLRQSDCQGISRLDYAEKLAGLANRDDLPDGRDWRLRYEAAQQYAAERRDRTALRLAEQVWQAKSDELAVGMFLAGLHIRLGEYGAAARLLDRIGPRIPLGDRAGQALLQEYRDAIEYARANISLSGQPGGG